MSIGAISQGRSLAGAPVAEEHDGIPADVARWRDSEAAVTPRSYYGEVLRRLLRDRTALFACGLLLLIVGTSILAPFITSYDPIEGDVASRLRPVGTAGHIVGTDDAPYEGMAALTPLRRVGLPEDAAEAAVWLCSEDASFVTGQAITIDGGRRT